jgi:hypothetical protein
MNLNDQIEEIIALIKDFKGDPLVMDFLKSWENNLSLIKNKIKKDKLLEKDKNEIKEISSQIINSLILKYPCVRLKKYTSFFISQNCIT